jgi:hypothetical protein
MHRRGWWLSSAARFYNCGAQADSEPCAPAGAAMLALWEIVAIGAQEATFGHFSLLNLTSAMYAPKAIRAIFSVLAVSYSLR